jgi:hypothetical protein
MPRAPAIFERPAVRALLLAITACALGVAIVTVVYGPIRLNIGGSEVFRSSGLLRPLLITLVFGVLARAIRSVNLVIVPVLVAAVLPLPAYREALSRLNMGEHPIRSAADCVLRVAARPDLVASGPRGMYVDGDGSDYVSPFNHEYTYYFRKVNPWLRSRTTSREALYQYMYDPSQQRPMLISESRYRALRRSFSGGTGAPVSPSLMVFADDVLFLLPGPYAVCSPDVAGLKQLR